MKIYEMMPTKKTFFLMPEQGESAYSRIIVEICYDTRKIIVKGTINPITIDVSTRFYVDPITTLLSYNKEDILKHMGIHASISLQESHSRTLRNVNKKCKELGIPSYNIQSDIYDEMIETHHTYSEVYAFEALCSIIKKHNLLSQYADELIETVTLWPEHHEFIANLLIEKLFPILKTIPTINTNAILIEK